MFLRLNMSMLMSRMLNTLPCLIFQVRCWRISFLKMTLVLLQKVI